MSDFVANIGAKLDTQKAESQLQAFIKNNKTIDVTLNITNLNNIVSQINNAINNGLKGGTGRGSSAAGNLGQTLGNKAGDEFYKAWFAKQKQIAQTANALANAYPTAKADAKADSFYKRAVAQRDREIEKYTSQFNVGAFDAGLASMQKSLDAFSGQSAQSLTKAQDALKTYRAEFEQIQKHFDTKDPFKMNDKELVDSFKRMGDAAKQFKNAMVEVNAETTKSLSPLIAQTRSNDILTYMENNTRATRKYGEQLKQLAIDARNATTVGEMNEINERFAALKSTISAEGLTGKSIFSEISRGLKQIGQFAGTYRLIMQIPRLISNMVKEVRAVDAAMIELRKVSNATDKELTQSFEHATVSAKNYGISISDVISSTADWSRLGYDLPDAEKLADATTLLQRVGDNMTQQSASESLVSTLQGFQLDASEIGSIVDKFNEVAKIVG